MTTDQRVNQHVKPDERYIVFNPAWPEPPTVWFQRFEGAKLIAESLAQKQPTHEFFIMERRMRVTLGSGGKMVCEPVGVASLCDVDLGLAQDTIAMLRTELAARKTEIEAFKRGYETVEMPEAPLRRAEAERDLARLACDRYVADIARIKVEMEALKRGYETAHAAMQTERDLARKERDAARDEEHRHTSALLKAWDGEFKHGESIPECASRLLRERNQWKTEAEAREKLHNRDKTELLRADLRSFQSQRRNLDTPQDDDAVSGAPFLRQCMLKLLEENATLAGEMRDSRHERTEALLEIRRLRKDRDRAQQALAEQLAQGTELRKERDEALKQVREELTRHAGYDASSAKVIMRYREDIDSLLAERDRARNETRAAQAEITRLQTRAFELINDAGYSEGRTSTLSEVLKELAEPCAGSFDELKQL